ncbi:single-stranded DNA-binding protein [Microlunatus speluncae]|uniref:single-stranded DNA-binding protein n=1 Tax=Microlunatus speluncae TaxID=2594267 RepID=UPI001375FEF3|nr:single-stranded DNA-binding protein [Microlunatus speluncae]
MDTYVSMTGWVGGAVEYRCLTSPDRSYTTHHASFRLAATPRVRRGGVWIDGVTNWITVVCFRALAQNVGSSVSKGDPVHVWGKLRRETWERDGETNERTVIEAVTVGHDLARGTSMFKKTERNQPYEEADMGDLIETVERSDGAEDDLDGAEPASAEASADRLAMA